MVGGWAYNFYADARPTGDYDFFVPIDKHSETSLRQVLSEFGFEETLPLPDKALLQKNKVLMLGRKPMRIDILTTIDGVDFEDAWNTKVEGYFGNIPVFYISKELLIKNKTASGREKDLRDVAMLRKI